MIIRSASEVDIPFIRTIAHTTWPVAYGAILSAEQLAYMLDRMYAEEVLREQLLVKGHLFLLAEENGTVQGFTGFEHTYQGTAHTRLHKLYVLPEAQGKAVGRMLLNAVVEQAKVAGDTGVELNVNRFNPAKDFYLKHGFRVERDEVIDIGQGHVMDDHVMVLDLA
jgi:GNAT superfamily N-acetyltransferase